MNIEIIDPGHEYKLPSFDGELAQTITFLKREGEGYPGNVGSHAGTTLQCVLRACLDRVEYLHAQIPHENNYGIVSHIRHALLLLEQRAAERHGINPMSLTLTSASENPLCGVCGHVTCHHS